MATYKDIDSWVRVKYKHSVKSCWIAHVKKMHLLPMGRAPNRHPGRENPCPSWAKPHIETAMRHFGWI